jgi:hypothetical protein
MKIPSLTQIYPKPIYKGSTSILSSHLQRMDKIMETVVKDAHFFINTKLGNHLPVTQLATFLE